MKNHANIWSPLFRRAAIAFTATGIGMLLLSPKADAQTPEQNKAIVLERFNAWNAGTGGPFELLTEDASWTIEGNNAASGTYPTKEAFMSKVIRPFNARMVDGIKPSIRSITAQDDRVVILFDAQGMANDGNLYVNSYAWFFQMERGRVIKANAFFDAIAFNDLWSRVEPARN